MSARLAVELQLVGAPHRLWCGLFTSDVPRCTCGQLSVEQLVGWWTAAASPRVVPARYHAVTFPGTFAAPTPGRLSKGR